MEQQSGIPLVRLGTQIICSPQIDLDDVLLSDLEHQILDAIRSTQTLDVVLDVSGVPVIDAHQARALDDLAHMTALMGAMLTITGINAGVASSLALLGFRFAHARLARSPEHVLPHAPHQERHP
jgi:anti-anti-sigma regulatory factor